MTPAGWRSAAEYLARAFPRERLHPSVVRWADSCAPAERWGVAFSGGADSVALLLLMWAHWPDRRSRLSALHFDHRLRGRESTADERFCRRTCAALGIAYASCRWAAANRDASEAEARAVRHAFFRQELKARRAHALWFGHQQDDIAETLLMRLARGSGLGGLAAPRPVQSLPDGLTHLRPLLTLKKQELIDALRAAGGSWREDRTNAQRDFLRNRMRLDVLPAWSAAMGDRDVLGGAALSRELIEEDDAALDAWLADLAPMTKRGHLLLRRIAGKPRGLQRRALQQWLSHHGRSQVLSRQAFGALLDDLVRARVTRHSLGVGAFAVLGERHLTLAVDRGKKPG